MRTEEESNAPGNRESRTRLRSLLETAEDERSLGPRRVLERVVGPDALHCVRLTLGDAGRSVRAARRAEDGGEVGVALRGVRDDAVGETVECVALSVDEGADRVVVGAVEVIR